MSYGLRYTVTFRDEVLSTTLWQVNIYKNSYVGSSASVSCSDNPITLSYKQQDLISPIMGSELTIGLMSTTNGKFIEFATAAPLQYYVDVLRSIDNGTTWSTYWSGVNTTDCYSEPYQNKPYTVNLKFNCGLGELQWHRYENSGNLMSGLEQLAAIFANCLSFLPYTKNIREIINIREDTQLDSKGFLEQTFLSDTGFTEIADDGLLHGINCNKLLNQLCTALNLRIYQSNDMWYVERIWERTGNTMAYFDYQPTGAMEVPTYVYANIGSGTFNSAILISNSTQPKLVGGGDWAVTQKKPSLSYNFNTQQMNNVELITNAFFEDTPTNKDVNGRPLFWDRGSSLVSGNYPLNIEVVNPYTSDNRYRWGVSFSQQCIVDFNTYMNSIGFTGGPGGSSNSHGMGNLPHGSVWGNTFLDQWAIKSVRRTGDTYTQPWLYIDPINGSLQVNIQLYFDWQLTCTSSNWSNYALNDAQNITACALSIAYVQIPIRLAIVNLNTGTEYAVCSNTIQAQPEFTSEIYPYSGFYTNACAWPLYAINNAYPDPEFTGQATPLNSGSLATLMVSSNASGIPLHLKFNTVFNQNVTFDTSSGKMPTTPGVYAFICSICPPVICDNNATAGKYGTNLKYSTIVLNDFAVNAVDVQYQDSFIGLSSFTKFYQAPDINNRWSEQKVSAVFGDSLTPGYPGSFRLTSNSPYNATPTVSWHVKGQSNPYTFNSSTSGGDPGSGEISLNNSTPKNATHLYISTTNSSSSNVSSWLAAMVGSKNIVVSDNTTGAQYVFATGTPVNNTTYYDIPITYVSGTGTLSNTNVIQVAYEGGQNLADILFSNYESLIASYRRKITGKIVMNGGIPFYNNIEDEDGYVYAQTGSTFDFKKGMLTINMEEVSTVPIAVVNQFTSFSGSKSKKVTTVSTTTATNTAPLTSLSKVSIAKTTPVSASIYPAG